MIGFESAETDYRAYQLKQFVTWNEKKQLDMNPPYQRNVVWSDNKKRALIESIMRSCPIPSLMLSQHDNKRVVLDGKQRLTSILEFVNNKFALMIDNKPLYFKNMDGKDQSDFLNKTLPVSVTENLTTDDEALIFERINRAEKLSDGERIESFFKSPLAMRRNQFFNKSEQYLELEKMFGPYKTVEDKRKAHLANKTTTMVVFADGTIKQGTFDMLHKYLEADETQWKEYDKSFNERLDKFIQLWQKVLSDPKIVIPEMWQKPAKLWKHSFLTSYIVFSMDSDEKEYFNQWVKFIKALCRNPDLYKEWPHTKVTKDQASDSAKEHYKSIWLNGYYQVKYYNRHGYFDKKTTCIGLDEESDIDLDLIVLTNTNDNKIPIT
jgi:hypothetical protein